MSQTLRAGSIGVYPPDPMPPAPPPVPEPEPQPRPAPDPGPPSRPPSPVPGPQPPVPTYIDADRDNFHAGLPDYHDPLAGIGGAPAAISALTLRLVLAALGLLSCTAGAVVFAMVGSVGMSLVFAAAALIAVVDIAIIVRRKRRGEPG